MMLWVRVDSREGETVCVTPEPADRKMLKDKASFHASLIVSTKQSKAKKVAPTESGEEDDDLGALSTGRVS